MAITHMNVVVDSNQQTVKMLHNEYFLCFRPSVKMNWISGTLVCNMGLIWSPSMRLHKSPKPKLLFSRHIQKSTVNDQMSAHSLISAPL